MPAAASRADRSPTLTVVPDLVALEGAAGPWRALWRACRATPFSAPAWLVPWARAYAPDRTFALALQRQDRLVGLLPLFTWRGRLYLAGAGPSDYGETLLAPGEPDPGFLAGACAAAPARGCSEVELAQLRPGDPLLTAPAPKGWADRVEPGDPCPAAPITDGGLGAMAPTWKRSVAYTRRRLGRQASFGFETATPETLPALAADLHRLHAARWEARGEEGVLAGSLVRAHLDGALPALLEDGLLRLHLLRIDGRPAAAILALHAHDAVYAYISGFEPDLARHSPGSLLWTNLFETAAAEGGREVHFLRGQEPYKRHWGAEDQPTWTRVLTRL